MKISDKSASVWSCVLCAAALALSPGPAAAQGISGTVVDLYGNPLRGVRVTFHDGTNTERISAADTAFDGSYKSGLIPPGNYRVRFSASAYYPVFFGTGFDDYCQGRVVPVVPDGITSGVDQAMKPSEPAEVLVTSAAIQGVVVDAATGSPIAGVKVSLLDAVNGEAFLDATTDAAGEYGIGFKDLPWTWGRVRFSDPAQAYFPQFFGAEGLDDFCLSTVLDFTSKLPPDIGAAMKPISPDQLADILLDQVEGLALPENVVTVLATPLVQAASLLTDDNIDNDQGVCGQLTAFITRVDIQEKRGQLSPPEAAELRGSAETLRAALGCN